MDCQGLAASACCCCRRLRLLTENGLLEWEEVVPRQSGNSTSTSSRSYFVYPEVRSTSDLKYGAPQT
jgi:hypothetical protein